MCFARTQQTAAAAAAAAGTQFRCQFSLDFFFVLLRFRVFLSDGSSKIQSHYRSQRAF
jgi:hypothetical protein